MGVIPPGDCHILTSLRCFKIVTAGQAGASHGLVNNEPNIQHSAGDELRTRIVDAARKRFEQFGFAKTSMQEIAEACDMSAANLYRFYKGKLAIGVAVASQEQTALLTTCDHAIGAAGSEVPARLIALFHANIDATRRQMKRTPQLFELDMIVAREEPELRRQFLRKIERRILSILTEGTETNAFESAAIKLRCRMILMASAPFILPWMLLNEPFGSPRSMVEPLIRSLISGVNEATTGSNGSAPVAITATGNSRTTRRTRAV
jgi:AcrR family transcriptional regulator